MIQRRERHQNSIVLLDMLRNPFSYFTIVACDIFDNPASSFLELIA